MSAIERGRACLYDFYKKEPKKLKEIMKSFALIKTPTTDEKIKMWASIIHHTWASIIQKNAMSLNGNSLYDKSLINDDNQIFIKEYFIHKAKKQTLNNLFNKVFSQKFLSLEEKDLKLQLKLQLNLSKASPLIIAAAFNRKEEVKQLIKKGADCSLPDLNGWLPIHWAALGGYLETLKILFPFLSNINQQNEKGETLLHLSAKSGNLELVEFLIEKGANRDIADDNNETPLHHAALNSDLSMVSLLITKNNLNAKNNNANTPLILAILGNDIEVVDYLLNYAAAVDIICEGGKPPLFWAKAKGNKQMIRLIEDHIKAKKKVDEDSIANQIEAMNLT